MLVGVIAKFVCQLVTVVPLMMLIGVVQIAKHHGWLVVWDPKIWLRVFMREATSICDHSTIHNVLNPLFNWSCSWVISNDQWQYLPNGEGNNPEVKFVWYYKPPNFDPKHDNILVFIHGGGFALKMIPIELLFLSHLTELFPRMAIVIHDYTVSTESQGLLSQRDELARLYCYLLKEVHCEKLLLFGESAGGHIILSTLLQLQAYAIPLPKMAIVLSPWCNPFEVYPRDSIGHTLDSLTYDHLKLFQTLLLQRSHALDLESNFHEKHWGKIIRDVPIYISYGTHETLQHEIKSFSDKLMSVCSKNESNLVIFRDHQGAHIQPMLHLSVYDSIAWSQLPNIAPVIHFIMEYSA